MKYSVVLIHIGDEFYDYLNICISQIKRFNDCDIYMIIAEKHFSKISSKVKLISVESIEKSGEHKLFLTTTELDTNYRSGFWRSASERFFYLSDVVKQYELENVFHFENDIMIYCSLEEINRICLSHNFQMAATFDNDKRCIPGFVYFKNAEILERLTKFMITYPTKNDMELLALFNAKSERVNFFPVVPVTYKFSFFSRLKTRMRKEYSHHFDSFQTIFDAAAIGQYLGGIDPRNNSQKNSKGFINESALYNVSDFKFEWEVDDQDRNVPFAIYKNRKIKINNLHIHSKNLSDFQ